MRIHPTLKRTKAGRLAGIIVGSLLAVFAHPSSAAVYVLDQFNAPNQGLFGISPNENWQQEVTAGMSGTLSVVSIYTMSWPNTTFQFYVNLGGPWQSDQNVFQVDVTHPNETRWFDIDVSAANIQLTSGTHYVIGVIGASYIGGSDNVYSRGALWAKLGANPPAIQPQGDLAFATYMTPVPEPSTLALSMITLAAFVGMRRRVDCVVRLPFIRANGHCLRPRHQAAHP